jgi:hypothetical protein
LSRLFLSPKPLQRGHIDNKQFKDMTGIEVKKRRTYRKKATASQITDAGTIKPELSSDYVVYTTRDKDGATHYWKVSATLAKDASDKGISLYSGTALKTEAQLYAEVYYEGYYGASGEEQSAILEANQDDFVAHFGINYFTLYSNFVETFSGLQGTHVPEMEPVLDILRNFNKYASTDEDGVQGVFDDYSAACKTVLQSVADEYTGGIGWEYVEECFPEVAELFEYTNSDDDIKREWLGIAPASFTPEALAGALQKTWDEEKQFASATLDSAPMEREAMREEMGGDLSELSAYEILCVAAYIDSVVDPETSSPDGIPVVFREHGTMQALVSEGEQIYGAYTTWNYENIIAKKDSLPSVFVDEYMATQAEAGQVWDKLSLKEQSDFVLDMYAVYQEYNLPDEARGGGGGRSFTGSIFSTQTEKDAYTAWKERTGYKPEGRMSVPEEFYESEEYKNALHQDAETSYDNYIAATDAAAAGMLSEEDAQQVSELESSVNQSAVSYLDDLSSLFGTNVYGDTSTLSQDVNSAIDLLLQSYGATYGTNVYGATVGYIDVNSELGQVLTAAIADGADIMAATENGYAIYAGEAEILLKYLAEKFDSAINGTGWKFTEMNGWDYLTHGGFTLTQDLIRNLLSGKKEAAELTDADNAFLTAIGRIVYVNSYVLTEQFKADAQFISTFEAAMQQISQVHICV